MTGIWSEAGDGAGDRTGTRAIAIIEFGLRPKLDQRLGSRLPFGPERR